MAATNNSNPFGAGSPMPAPPPLHPFFTIPNLGSDGDFEGIGVGVNSNNGSTFGILGFDVGGEVGGGGDPPGDVDHGSGDPPGDGDAAADASPGDGDPFYPTQQDNDGAHNGGGDNAGDPPGNDHTITSDPLGDGDAIGDIADASLGDGDPFYPTKKGNDVAIGDTAGDSPGLDSDQNTGVDPFGISLDSWPFHDGGDTPSKKSQNSDPCSGGCDDDSMIKYIPASGVAAFAGLLAARSLIAASIGIATLPFGGEVEAENLVFQAIDLLGALIKKTGIPDPWATILETALNGIGVPSGPLDILGFAERAASLLGPAISQVEQQNGIDAFNALIKQLGGCICEQCYGNYVKYFGTNTGIKICRSSAH